MLDKVNKIIKEKELKEKELKEKEIEMETLNQEMFQLKEDMKSLIISVGAIKDYCMELQKIGDNQQNILEDVCKENEEIKKELQNLKDLFYESKNKSPKLDLPPLPPLPSPVIPAPVPVLPTAHILHTVGARASGPTYRRK